MPLLKLQFKPGIDKENTNYANEGGWYNCDKVRFRSGSPEKINGWQNYSSGYTFDGVVRSLWNWSSYAGDNLLAMGTNQKYYIELGGQYNDVTPLVDTDYLGVSTPVLLPNNPFATTLGSKLVTVNAPGNVVTFNSFVTFAGATTFAGLTLNGEFEVIGIPAASQFQIIAPALASATTTGGGAAVTAEYELPAGSVIDVSVSGWGAGPWGSGVWGHSGGVVAVPLRLWSQDNFLQDLLFNPRGGDIYYWTFDNSLNTSIVSRGITLEEKANGTIKTTTTATFIIGVGTIVVGDSDFIDIGAYVTGVGIAPATYVTGVSGVNVTLSNITIGVSTASAYSFSYSGMAVPNQTNYIVSSDVQQFAIALGANPYDPTNFNTTFDPLLVRWSDQNNPYDWTPTSFNQSGETHIGHGSFMVCAKSNRQEILLWSDSALFSMQYVGPPYVWNISLIMDNISIQSQNSAITVNNVTYWMGMDKFYQYSGRVDTLPCTLKRFVFDNINTDELDQIICGTNEGFDEVWWFYPSANSQINDSYVIFNHVDNIWYYGTLNRTAWLDSALRPFPMAAYSAMSTYLAASIDAVTTTIPVLNALSYPNTGTILIGSEYISYTSVGSNSFAGCTRGVTYNGVISVAASHSIYDVVSLGIPNQIMYHELGVDDGSLTILSPIASYLASADFDIEDGQHVAFVWRMIPDFTFDGSDATNPQIVLTVTPRLNPGSAYTTGVDTPSVTRTATIPVEQYTGQVYTRIRGRQMSMRIDSSDLGVKWQMGNTRIDIRPDGRR